MKSRVILFAAASVATLLATGAMAQSKAATAAAAAPVDVQELVVTGSRAEPRSRLESLAPVDVVTAKSLQKQGTTELAAALAATVPSIDFPRPSNTDGTDSVRPATLRGQGPDQTLVAAARPPSTSTPFRKWPSTVSRCCVTAPRRSTAPTPSPG